MEGGYFFINAKRTAAAYLLLFFISASGLYAQSTNVAMSSSAPDLSPMAVWVDGSSFIFGVREADLFDDAFDGDIVAILIYNYALPNLVSLLDDEDSLPDDQEQRFAFIQSLGGHIEMACSINFAWQTESDDGEIYNFYMVEEPALRNSIETILENF